MSESIEELLDKLNALTGNAESALMKSVLNACKKIQGDAKNLCPVNTGQLRSSITAQVGKDENDIVGQVGTNSDHAVYVEFGTGPVGSASEKLLPPDMTINYRADGWSYFDKKNNQFVHTKGQPARPYLYPAFKQNQSGVKEIIAQALRKELRKS